MDIAQRCAAEPDRRRHIGKSALHQHHICCINGNICSCPYGNSYIRSGKGRCVIDPIAYHSRLAACLQPGDHSLLSIRKDAGNHFVHTCLAADRPCRPFIVSCKHNHMDAHIFQLGNGLSAVFLHHIRHSDHSKQFSIPAEKQRRLSFL